MTYGTTIYQEDKKICKKIIYNIAKAMHLLEELYSAFNDYTNSGNKPIKVLAKVKKRIYEALTLAQTRPEQIVEDNFKNENLCNYLQSCAEEISDYDNKNKYPSLDVYDNLYSIYEYAIKTFKKE